MVNFFVLDIILLVAFAILVYVFLHTGRKNLKREGLLILYRTSLGIKLIDKFTKKYKRVLKFLAYVSVSVGYVLMAIMIYLFGRIIWLYAFNPEIVRAIKVPPITPLIPYLPRIFNLDFLPPFYFIYWIIIIAIVAIPHEFAHGIYASLNKVRIKSTGFGFFPFFLPVFLAFFVEQDERDMNKKGRFGQLAILSAGTFANIITAGIFFVIMWLFFITAFVPSGVQFDTYSYGLGNSSSITTVNGIDLQDGSYGEVLSLLNESQINEIEILGSTYYLIKDLFEDERSEELFDSGGIVVYDYAPAIKYGLVGAVVAINDVQIDSREKLGEELSKYSPGEEVTLTMFDGEGNVNFDVNLGEKDGKSFLGVGFLEREGGGIVGKFVSSAIFFKDPHVYYEPRNPASEFIYDLLWWLVLISISVALVNMLPVGIFDGGRFFYLTIAAMTGSEKIAKRSFSLVTWLFLLALALIMVLWAFSFM